MTAPRAWGTSTGWWRRRSRRPDVLRRHVDGADRHRGSQHGGEDAYRFNQIALAGATWAPGQDEALRRAGPPREILFGALWTPAAVSIYNLGRPAVVHRDGLVVGVQAQSFGETVSLWSARRLPLRGTRSSTTTCCASTARCARLFKVGTEGDDGRGDWMAQALGALVRNMYAGGRRRSRRADADRWTLVGRRGPVHQRGYRGRVVELLYEQHGEAYLGRRGLLPGELGLGLGAPGPARSAEQSRRGYGLRAGRSRPRSSSEQPSRQRERIFFHRVGTGSGALAAPIGAFDVRIGPAPYALDPRWPGDDGRRRGADLNGDLVPGLLPRRHYVGRLPSATPAPPSGTAPCSAVSRCVRAAARRSATHCAGRRTDDPRHDGVVRLGHGPAVDVRLRVVFDHELRRLGGRAVDEQLDQAQRHVDAARDAGGGDEAPVEVLDHARRDVGSAAVRRLVRS